MLPIPYRNYVPKMLQDTMDSDAGALALESKMESYMEEWKAEILEMVYLKLAERCPSRFLNDLGNMLEAGILVEDLESTKRSKIYNAIQYHKTRGSWEYHAKPLIESITGETPTFITAIFLGAWTLWAKETGEPDDYTGTLGSDGIDYDLGLDLISTGEECIIPGISCIDINDDFLDTIIASTSFKAAALSNIETCELDNGDFVIAYTDTGTGDCRFKIYDSTGVEQVAEQVVHAGAGGTHKGICALDDNKFVIVTTTATPTYYIYNSSGVLQTSGVIVSSVSQDRVSCARIDGDKWAVVMSLGASWDGTVYYFDYDTEEFNYTFDSGTISENIVRKINTAEFIIAYYDSVAGVGKYLIMNVDNSVTLAATAFSTVMASDLDMDVVDARNYIFAFSYIDTAGVTDLYYAVYKNATAVKAETLISGTVPSDCTLCNLQNGYFSLAYRDTTGEGRIVVYDSDGDQVTYTYLAFDANCNSLRASMQTINDQFVLLFYDATGTAGKFIIYNNGSGSDELNKIITYFTAEIAPAYYKVKFYFFDYTIDAYTLYPNATIG